MKTFARVLRLRNLPDGRQFAPLDNAIYPYDMPVFFYTWPMIMKPPAYDIKAAKRTVSLTINSDLYAQAKGFGINASRVAEEALSYEVARRQEEVLSAEIRQDLEACNDYTARHGSFAAMVREHNQKTNGDRAV